MNLFKNKLTFKIIKYLDLKFSFIIPVYNRPDEIRELLLSLASQSLKDFEVFIIEDGSTITSKHIVEQFTHLNIKYFYKENSGPGDSRNFGMLHSQADYFIILDSDCLLPKHYFKQVKESLEKDFVDCFGGPDAALASFSNIQKAINYSMTSLLTTGGIRGGAENLQTFQPRSFNMGLSKKAFAATKGFGNIHPGEDPDLTIRLWKQKYKTTLFKNAFVYHKRRIDWQKFYLQVNKFGKARPILDHWHPEYKKLTFVFPTLFLIGILFSITSVFFGCYIPLIGLLFYLIAILFHSTLNNKSLKIGCLSVMATLIQFYGYGTGYAKSYYKIKWLKQKPETAFPELFFKIL